MDTPARRIIFHIDLDAFYVSVEARENPSLLGKPVVVCTVLPGEGRGVIMTCSYEARKFGLRSGMPISRAWKLCPQAIYLRHNDDLYEHVSQEVVGTIKEFGDRFEQTGIDEAFLDVTARVRSVDDAVVLANTLKEKIRDVHGLTSSIGIGPNKSTAKIASDMQKPDGLTIVPLDGAAEFLAPLNVTVIPGVGKKTEIFLKERGVETIGQLQAVPGKQLIEWFGKTGVWLWGVVHAQENILVTPREMPKTLSVERTFREDLTDFGRVRAEAVDAANELVGRVKQGGFRFRVAGIKIRFHGFETHTREKTLNGYTDSGRVLREVVDDLFKEFEIRDEPIRLIGVRVADLEKDASPTRALDSWT